MAEWAEQKAPVSEPDAGRGPETPGGDGPDGTPPMWLPPDPADAMLRRSLEA